MNHPKFTYKRGVRKDTDYKTVWKCETCMVSSMCCSYSKNKALTLDMYEYKCPQYIGVEEDGIMCSIPNSLDFILSGN